MGSMTIALAEKQHLVFMTGATLEACRDMQEAEEIWGVLENQQAAWDLNASWTSFRTWVSHFGEGQVPLLKIMADGRAVGLFPCFITRRSAVALSFRVLGSVGNQHWTTGYPIIGREPEAAIRALMAAVSRRRDWDVLEIGPMVSDCPLVQLLIANGKEAHLAPVICHQEDDWRVQIDGTWEEYYRGRTAKLRRDVGRGERRLAELGEVTFEVFTGGPEFSERFAEFCRVEGSGWKGRAGTAIECDPAVMNFQADLMRSAGRRGRLCLFFLRLNGRAVACVEDIIQGDTAYSVKIGRDEALAECALGNVVLKHRLEHLFRSREASTFDMMIGGGAHGSHKARWATDQRQYITLRFFNPKTIRGALARCWFSTRSFARTLRAVPLPRDQNRTLAAA